MSARDYSEQTYKDIEQRVQSAYSQALGEMQSKLEDFLETYEKENKEWQAKYTSGDVTLKEYKAWLRDQLTTRYYLKTNVSTLADDLTNASTIAESIVNGEMADVYATGHAWATFEIEEGTSINTAYTLYNRDAVNRLIRDGEIQLPAAKVDIPKDKQWNRQHIASAITQGILQGENISRIQQRLMSAVGMGERSALRMARTCIIGAENAGTLDGYKRSAELGINVQKQWLATLDNRTRHSHLVEDGEVRELDEEFSNGLQYPGDPNGKASEVYNCRCTIVPYMPDYEMDDPERINKLSNERYEEWKAAHQQNTSSALSNMFSGLANAYGQDFATAMSNLLDENGSGNMKTWFGYGNDVSAVVYKSDKAYYSHSTKSVYMNPSAVARASDWDYPYQTAFHELTHAIDDKTGNGTYMGYTSRTFTASNGMKLSEALKSDWDNLMKDFLQQKLDSTDSSNEAATIKKYFGGNIKKKSTAQKKLDDGTLKNNRAAAVNEIAKQMSDAHSLKDVGTVSDAMEGLTGQGYPLGVGHGSSYYKKIPERLESEFIANRVSEIAAGNSGAAEFTQEIFPTACEVVDEILGSV